MPKKKKVQIHIPPKHPLGLTFLSSCLLIFIFSSAFSLFQYKETGVKGTESRCVITGCNSEICQNKNMETQFSTCIYSPKFECYKDAKCEEQTNGECSWTWDDNLVSCLEKNAK